MAQRVRTVPREGQAARIERIGEARDFFGDLYHYAMDMSWWRLVSLTCGLYLAANFLFAALYIIDPHGIANSSGSYRDAFFFSVQTMATIGYGGMAPASLYAHILVTAEALVGLLSTAMVTGLMFAKFSRARSRILFSEFAVVTARDGQLALMFRMANQRRNQIVEARLSVVFARDELTQEGERIRRLHDLKLARERMLSFALSWTAIHPIDKDSPFFGQTSEQLIKDNVEIIVSLMGHDETVGQTAQRRFSYLAEDIRFGHRFIDIIRFRPDGSRYVDYRPFHETEPNRPPATEISRA